MTKIAIIDLDSILYAGAWGKKIPDGKGDFQRDEKGRLIYEDKSPEEIMSSIDNILIDTLDGTEATHYITFVKGKSTGAHRYQAKPDYKANRPKDKPSWWNLAKSHVMDNWGAISVDNIEVDDAVAITTKSLSDSFIVAIDKDLLQLEGYHYNWREKEWINTSKEESVYAFWRDMIVGQSGDGISGLPGKGKAYFNNYILKNHKWFELEYVVFSEYLKYYGQHKGIQEFYQNYTCLKILEEFEGFEIPEPIEFKLKGEQLNIWEEE